MHLYHILPQNMQGTTLYPLNRLKEVDRSLYEQERSKYQGREEIMEHRIPILDCLWNDVLHLSAVHPSDIKQAMIEAGREGAFSLKCVEIETQKLEYEKLVVYLYQQSTPEEKLQKENFVAFSQELVEVYKKVPEETKSYYRQCYNAGKRPLVFYKIPHFLYQGTIDIKDCNIIEV